MIGLVRKEVRDLRPFLLLGVFLLLLDLGEWSMQEFDMRPLGLTFAETGQEVAAFLFLLAFALGSGLLVREMDDRTLGFLDGLPVTRLRVFSVKTSVAGAMLLLYPAGHLLMMSVQHVVSRESLDHALHPGLLWHSFVMICVVTAVGLAAGMLLGFLRNLCWLVLALIAIILRVVTLKLPEYSVFNPLELVNAQLVGVHWQVPITTLATQLGILIACLLGSMAIFLGGDGGQGRKLQLRLGRPLVSAAVTLTTIGAVFAAFAVYVSTSEEAVRPRPGASWTPPGADFAPSPAGSARTEYYSFSYTAQRAGLVQVLLRDADKLYADVAAILKPGPGPRIDVDLSGSMENTEGTAFHDRIRMYPGAKSRVALAHETAHVLARRLAGGERERELSKMRALNEGIAGWIGNLVAAEGGVTELDRLQAAIVSRRHLLRPEQLTDMEALSRDVDQNLQYPLGAVLVDSIVARYGRDALRKVLVALGNPDFPRDLQGSELWYAAFQAAGLDLALVFDDYSRRLQEWESVYSAQIAALPRPRGSLVRNDGEVGVELRFEGELPEGWTAMVRFRPDEDSSLDQYSVRDVDEDFVAWVPVSQAVAGQLCFQPGMATNGAVIYEAWVCLPLDSAARWEE